MNPIKEQEEAKDDFAKGIAYFWRSTNLEPHIRSVALCAGISKVALGNSHTLLLTFNSELLSVGDNSFGQLGLGDGKPRREPTQVDYFRDKRVLDICCGGHHSGVICANNEVYFWGDSSSGQCGIGDIKLANQPSRVQFERYNIPDTRQTHLLTQQDRDSKKKEPVITQIACGDSHSLALSIEGEIWSWGTGCQLGHGTEIDKVTIPKQIELLIGKHVTSVCCGAYHSLAVIQEDQSCPTFMNSCSDRDVTSQPAKTPKRGKKSKKKQRKPSKGSPQKSQVTGQHEYHRNLTDDAGSGLLNIEKPSIARTYLSYVPVVTEKSAEGVFDIVANKPPILEQDQVKENASNKEKQNLDSLDNADLYTVVNSQDEAPEMACHSSLGKSTPNDINFASLEETTDKYVNINCEHTKSLKETQTVASVETSKSNENISNFYTPDESPSLVSLSSPSSDMSISYFASTDSDSEDSLTKVSQEKKPSQTAVTRKYSSGFYSAISSRLIRPDVNLSKLTSAVVGSVTGMFTTSGSVPGQFSHNDPPGAVIVKVPCKQCGLLGLCLCDADGSKFKMAGANTQVWSWGRGGCGQLGLGDTEDR